MDTGDANGRCHQSLLLSMPSHVTWLQGARLPGALEEKGKLYGRHNERVSSHLRGHSVFSQLSHFDLSIPDKLL